MNITEQMDNLIEDHEQLLNEFEHDIDMLEQIKEDMKNTIELEEELDNLEDEVNLMGINENLLKLLYTEMNFDPKCNDDPKIERFIDQLCYKDESTIYILFSDYDRLIIMEIIGILYDYTVKHDIYLEIRI